MWPPATTFASSVISRFGSSRSASSPACRRNVPIRSRWLSPNRVSTSCRVARTSSSAQRQDPRQHRTRAGLLELEALLAGHEQPGDHAPRIGRDPLRAAGHELARRRSHCGTGEKRRACCRVDDHGERRFRALVEVHPVGVQPVEAAAGLPGPTSAGRGRCRRGTRPRRTGCPRATAPAGRWPRHARTRRRGWPPRSAAGRTPGCASSGPAALDGGRREMTVARLDVQQPLQQVQAALHAAPSRPAPRPAAIIASASTALA